MIELIGKNGDKYKVDEIVSTNNNHELYRCHGSGRELLLQLAKDKSRNEYVSKNALILSKLQFQSDSIDPTNSFNYKYGFPELMESLVLNDGRQLNILNLRNSYDLFSIIPIIKMWNGSTRIDLRTSAWIMGKLLKLISFAHLNSIEINDITGNNLLLDPKNHYTIILNWSNSIIHDDIPKSIVSKEIKKAANLVVKALGGDLKRTHVNEADAEYTDHLASLLANGHTNASRAHYEFYNVITSLCNNQQSVWHPGFHEFTILDKNSLRNF